MEEVIAYIEKSSKWSKELTAIRNILQDCLLQETIKWKCPCYTFEGKNILLLHYFKDYCAILFFKGAL